jgi:hypothetical protein
MAELLAPAVNVDQAALDAGEPARKYWRVGDDFTPIPRCEWCRSYLVDGDGKPRWEIFDHLTFVCYGGCRARQVHHRAQGPRFVGRRAQVAA